MQITNVRDILQRCIDYHGYYCAGQSLGVRIAKKGLELVEAEDQKDLIVFVENDRCIADAVLMASGTRLGRRSLKFVDYGKMAATFINLKKDIAYRVDLKPVDQDDAPRQDGQDDAKERVLTVADDELLFWNRVTVSLKKEELPGKPNRWLTHYWRVLSPMERRLKKSWWVCTGSAWKADQPAWHRLSESMVQSCRTPAISKGETPSTPPATSTSGFPAAPDGRFSLRLLPGCGPGVGPGTPGYSSGFAPPGRPAPARR